MDVLLRTGYTPEDVQEGMSILEQHGLAKATRSGNLVGYTFDTKFMAETLQQLASEGKLIRNGASYYSLPKGWIKDP